MKQTLQLGNVCVNSVHPNIVYEGTVVSKDEASEELQKYWGYNVRVADSINEWFTEWPYDGGYDWVIGTSDRGQYVEDTDFSDYKGIKHAIIFFGGLEGIEGLIENDETIDINPDEAHKLFQIYLNTCPNQGSATIRTEEAILITLCKLCPILNNL